MGFFFLQTIYFLKYFFIENNVEHLNTSVKNPFKINIASKRVNPV